MTDERSQPSIVEQLRTLAELLHPDNTDSDAGFHLVCDAAADRIEELERQAERAHEAWLAAERRIEELETHLEDTQIEVRNLGNTGVPALKARIEKLEVALHTIVNGGEGGRIIGVTRMYEIASKALRGVARSPSMPK